MSTGTLSTGTTARPGTDVALGLDVGGSSVKAWVATLDGTVVAEATEPLATLRPGRHRAELDPAAWWAACRAAATRAVAASGATAFAGVTASSLRQGFVLLDAAGQELGPGVLNSDRRGAGALDAVRAVPDLYAITGHWPAPELTLPKLLALAAEEPGRWAAARRLLFVHDWLLWRLCGVAVTEVSYACAGQLADVARRDWARDLLAGLGLRTDVLADLVEPGTVVGRLTAGALPGVPAGTPVVAGCGDTQLAAAGAAGLEPGTVCVVAGSSTPVLAAAASPPLDGPPGPWVSTHLTGWAAETNAGYPGTMAAWWAGVVGQPAAALWAAAARSAPGAGGVTAVFGTPRWDEAAWTTRAPAALVGLGPAVTADDLARAVVEAHAVTAAAQVADLEAATGAPAARVVVTGGAATAPGSGLAQLLADMLGRTVALATGSAARAGAALVAGSTPAPGPATEVAPSGADHAAAVARWHRVHAALHQHVPEEDP